MMLVKMFCAFSFDRYFGYVKQEFLLAAIAVWTGTGFM